MFFSGMAINMHSDYTLIGLRKPGEKGYKIPTGTPARVLLCARVCVRAYVCVCVCARVCVPGAG